MPKLQSILCSPRSGHTFVVGAVDSPSVHAHVAICVRCVSYATTHARTLPFVRPSKPRTAGVRHARRRVTVGVHPMGNASVCRLRSFPDARRIACGPPDDRDAGTAADSESLLTCESTRSPRGHCQATPQTRVHDVRWSDSDVSSMWEQGRASQVREPGARAVASFENALRGSLGATAIRRPMLHNMHHLRSPRCATRIVRQGCR